MTSGITIVPAEKKDLPLIRDLAPEIWQHAYGRILSPEQISYMLDMMYALPVLEKAYSDGVKFRLICSNGTPVGFFSFFECPEERSVIKLDKLYLSPAFHGKGVGSAALSHLTGCASDAGYAAIKLNVNKQNKKAISAYTRNGFKKKESVKVDIGNGFFMDDYIMEKKLF